MHVGFLFNHYVPHQVPHAAPYAFELSRLHDDLCVTIACSTHDELEASMAIGARYPGHRCTFVRLKVPWHCHLRDVWHAGQSFKRKRWVLQNNGDFFASLDVLVSPEKNCLKLKSMHKLDQLKFIHTRHGAGDAAAAFDERCRAFDFLLLPGEKYADRLKAQDWLQSSDYAVVGYPKFEVFDAPRQRRRKLFGNDNPVVVYNPHFDERISSWQSVGLKVLDFFIENKDYNLIFAPHVVLFKRHKRHGAMLPRHYEHHDNILIDKGSIASADMTYMMAADIYLGDVSSQVYEFLIQPRPCIFLSPYKLRWKDDRNYENWQLGQVVDDVDTGLRASLDRAPDVQPTYAARQVEAFHKTFRIEPDSTAASRGARAIAEFLNLGSQSREDAACRTEELRYSA
ncbi:MAG: CDP-glycerol glycerophosphotransferase family protein [Geminicoccaceae bacterium]